MATTMCYDIMGATAIPQKPIPRLSTQTTSSKAFQKTQVREQQRVSRYKEGGARTGTPVFDNTCSSPVRRRGDVATAPLRNASACSDDSGVELEMVRTSTNRSRRTGSRERVKMLATAEHEVNEHVTA